MKANLLRAFAAALTVTALFSATATAADATTLHDRYGNAVDNRYGQPVQERYSHPAPAEAAATPAPESSTPESSAGG